MANLTRAASSSGQGSDASAFHDLRHFTATLLLEHGVELVVIKELLGHAHIGVTATVCDHVRLRPSSRDAIGPLAPRSAARRTPKRRRSGGDEPPSCVGRVR
ncbi:tyrosine-type recombinase/integrase [Actinoalloteichus caeruleus]|uniref:tyrosine-type recombinase/integrase n=1 Tax=Actinoalloteichus cyanogriseus TaxID=2893586 RepID=UPI0009DFE91A|nr:tyrosine-type recombinase/integrase [Actinoalloteichus caeruleus]